MSLPADVATLRTLLESCVASHDGGTCAQLRYDPNEQAEGITMIEMRVSRIYHVERNPDYPAPEGEPAVPEWISQQPVGKGLYSRQTQPVDENGVPVVDGAGAPVLVTEYYDLAGEIHRAGTVWVQEEMTPGSNILVDFNAWVTAQTTPSTVPTA